MDEATEKIVYEESARGIAQQQTTLDGLRGRGGLLIAAASVTTGFLGAQALAATETVEKVAGTTVTHSHVTGLGWVAVVCFAGVILASLAVLVPWRNWIFSHDAHGLMDALLDRDPPATAAELYRHLAYYNEEHSRDNAGRLGLMFGIFGVGCALLLAETIVWLLVIGRG